jgi:N-acetyldiaminopimelate deacetylase
VHFVLQKELNLNLLFLFQPAEEGHGGAKHIIDTGVFNNYQIKSAFALHVSGQYPTGTIGIKKGIILGIPQEFDIEIIGKSGHVATPNKGRDAFMAGMAYYQEMNYLIAKRFPAQEPIIFHIGKVESGTVRNITPDHCKLEGTFRCLDKSVKDDIIKYMRIVAKSIENSHDVEVKIILLSSYDPVINDDKLTELFINNLPDDVNVVTVNYSMTGEDFGFFSGMYPSVMFWLGTNCDEDLHSNKFLPDDGCIEVGLKIFEKVIINII